MRSRFRAVVRWGLLGRIVAGDEDVEVDGAGEGERGEVESTPTVRSPSHRLACAAWWLRRTACRALAQMLAVVAAPRAVIAARSQVVARRSLVGRADESRPGLRRTRFGRSAAMELRRCIVAGHAPSCGAHHRKCVS